MKGAKDIESKERKLENERIGLALLIIGNYAHRGWVIRIYVHHDNPEGEGSETDK
jgi:hypothetical protein